LKGLGEKYRVAIGIPAYSDLSPKIVDSWLRMCEATHFFLPGISLFFKITNRLILHKAEEAIIAFALRVHATHLLFLEEDICVQNDTLVRLLMHNKDIVGALYFQREPPYAPLILYRVGDNKKAIPVKEIKRQGLIECDATGFGCVLLKRKVLIDVGTNPLYCENFIGMDISYFLKARDLGYKVYVDTDHVVKHMSAKRIFSDEKTREVWLNQVKQNSIWVAEGRT